MSTQDPTGGPPANPLDNIPPVPENDAIRRGVSVNLRGGTVGAEPDSLDAMDPANKSLRDAIQITYRIVQLAMVLLGVLFLFSGVRNINEGERGIRLLFGRRDPELMQPGKSLSAPYPLGELVKVSTGVVTLDLTDEFWPFVSREDRLKPIEQLGGGNSLKPEKDGSLITSDGSLVHTQWRVQYGRTDPGLFSESLLPDVEQALVKAAVQRGVVQAAAQIKVDDLLKQSNDDASSLASRAREVAQRTLDTSRSGITIERLSLIEKMPPLYLKDKFAAVQTAQQKSQQIKEKAASDAQQRLSETAGGASAAIIALIDQYEVAIDKNDVPAQERILAQIDTIIEGRAEEPSMRVAGAVTTLLSQAIQYRSSISNQRRSDVSAFLAKQEQFASNPLVTVHREWSDALRAFGARPTVEMMLVPVGTHTLTMVINRDPDIAREIESKMRLDQAEKARLEREAKQKESQFRTDEGLKATPKG